MKGLDEHLDNYGNPGPVAATLADALAWAEGIDATFEWQTLTRVLMWVEGETIGSKWVGREVPDEESRRAIEAQVAQTVRSRLGAP